MPILGLAPSSKPVYPAHFDIEKVVRPNILALHPYRCARDDYKDGILLDANENALGHSIQDLSTGGTEIDSASSLDLHRYPDPSYDNIKSRIAELRGIPGAVNHVFLGVGSDEIIDMLMRVCVTPGKEKVLTTPPTYGMYAVCAQVNDVGVVKVPLELTGDNGEGGEKGRFSVRVDEIKKAVDADPSIKLIVLCSPGNPTGTSIPLSSIREVLEYPNYKGIVIVDEAYIDFASGESSAVSLVNQYSNLVVMQTLSKSFGLAAIRLGIAIAQPPLIQVLTNTKAPYNISTPSAHLALSALSPPSIAAMRQTVDTLISSREKLEKSLSSLPTLGKAIGGSEANFLLIPVLNASTGEPDNARANTIYKELAEERGVVVRFRGNEPGCLGCLRVTVGTEEENVQLVKMLEVVLAKI